MKLFFLLLVSLVFCSFAPVNVADVTISLGLVLTLIVGIYEVLVRAIPSIGDYSILAKIINIIKIVSDYLNKRKSKR